MRVSARFRSLVSRIRELEKRLIPKTRPAGDYTARQSDLVRAYRLLVHAEFEAYFEDRALEIADAALSAYVRLGRSGRTLAALMAFSPLAPQSTPSSLSSKASWDTPRTRVQRVVAQFKNSIREANHGIKEANIIALFYPVGLSESDLDPTFLNTLNSYGGSRGSTAHQSVHAQRPIDPVSERKIVNDLMAEIRKLDLLLRSLLKQ